VFGINEGVGTALGLSPVVSCRLLGRFSHVSFYKKNISVLGNPSGGHPQYHTPEDTVDLINFEGSETVCEYIFNAIMKVASTAYCY